MYIKSSTHLIANVRNLLDGKCVILSMSLNEQSTSFWRKLDIFHFRKNEKFQNFFFSSFSTLHFDSWVSNPPQLHPIQTLLFNNNKIWQKQNKNNNFKHLFIRNFTLSQLTVNLMYKTTLPRCINQFCWYLTIRLEQQSLFIRSSNRT